MKCYGKFDDSKTGSKVTAVYRNGINDIISKFITNFNKLLGLQLP